MGISKKIKRVRNSRPPQKPRPHLEATPERLAQADGDAHSALVAGAIDKAGERALLCRRFSDSQLDRLRRTGRLTDAQWYAGDWYRARYEEAGLTGRVVANYGATSGGGECSYGMPTSERQARARQAWRKARALMPANMLGLIDDLVLRDRSPALAGGLQRARYAGRIGRALQPLADWLRPADTT